MTPLRVTLSDRGIAVRIVADDAADSYRVKYTSLSSGVVTDEWTVFGGASATARRGVRVHFVCLTACDVSLRFNLFAGVDDYLWVEVKLILIAAATSLTIILFRPLQEAKHMKVREVILNTL